jgi:hypothetical protein
VKLHETIQCNISSIVDDDIYADYPNTCKGIGLFQGHRSREAIRKSYLQSMQSITQQNLDTNMDYLRKIDDLTKDEIEMIKRLRETKKDKIDLMYL